MIYNLVVRNINEALPDLMHKVLEGSEVGSRVGRTVERMHVGVTLLKPWEREILIPARKANLAAQIAETMWVLAGRDDVDWLSNYMPRARDYSDDGLTWRGAYGPRLRDWHSERDQLAHVIDLLKRDGTTRRAVMSIYDPEIDMQDGKDIPCNDFLQFTSRLGKLDLHVFIRSNDLMWGWSGINAFEWSTLLEIVASMVGVGVGNLHFSITSLHLYDRHWGKARDIARDLTLAGKPSPRFTLGEDRSILYLGELINVWFSLEQDIRNGKPVDVDLFPEPMLRSWLRVLQWWWSRDSAFLEPLAGTTLWQAAQVAVQPKTPVSADPFGDYVTRLHEEKHAAYGDSWKRRGEMLGIMANIARKVDRLGVNGAGDTATDTAIDLVVYLAKYLTWLDPWGNSDTPEQANSIIRELKPVLDFSNERLEHAITTRFAALEPLVLDGSADRDRVVSELLTEAYTLARALWEAEQK